MLEGGAIHPQAAHLGPRPPVPLSPLLTVPDRPPCRRPRPGLAVSARPHRPSRSARSACAAAAGAPPPARAAAALGAPPGPPPARGPPLTPAACSAGPRAVTHPATVCDTQLQGPEIASHTVHTLTGSHSPTLPHTHTGSPTASQTLSTSTHSHCHPLTWGHTGSNIQTVSRSHKLTRRPALEQGPTASHTVKHSNTVTTIHAVSYTSTHMPHTVAHLHEVTKSVIYSHITHSFTITQHHTLLHTQTCYSPYTLTWGSYILHCHPLTHHTVTGHK